METWRRAVVLVLVAVVVALPALRRPPTDGFPLSTYPMFASDRGPTSVVATAVGRTAADGSAADGSAAGGGDRVRLSPEELAGTDEPMMAIAAARRAVEDGRADTWCAEVARRVADRGRARGTSAEVVAIEVAVETHDAVAHFTDDAPPLAIDVRATCPVPGPGPTP